MRRDWVLVVLLLLCSCGGKASPQAADPFPRAVAIGSEVPSSPFAEAALLEEATRLCAPDFAGRGSYQQGSALASQYVYDELAKLGYEMHRQAIRGHAETIIAVKRGDENAVLISAHHDHLGTQKGDVYWVRTTMLRGLLLFWPSLVREPNSRTNTLCSLSLLARKKMAL